MAQTKMAKHPKNKGKQWTSEEIQRLRELNRHNTPTPIIAWRLGRTNEAVRQKASEQNISLKPTNKSPYNRRKR